MAFLIQVTIFLAAAVIAVPVFRWLGLGAVLGYLAAGMVVGPRGLGLAGDVDSILHFAEFGVVLLLFVIGLELQPNRLWIMRRSVFGLGGAQVLASATAIALVGIALGVSPLAAIIAGLGLSLSSTAFALQTLAEKGQLTARHGRAAFSVLLFQDLAAIPILAIVPLLGGGMDGASGGAIALGVAKVAAVLAVVVVGGRLLLNRLLRLVAASGIREAFTAMALLTVVVTALLMQLVGLSMALGAFLAGVLLAESEYRHALEADIEPFKGLLLGLFFIAVGMSIDLRLLVDDPLTVFGLVAGLIALKGSILFVLCRSTGAHPLVALRLAATIAQGGEFAFVIFGVARQARVLPGDWEALLTAAVAISMAITPLMVLAHEKLAARRASKQSREYDKIDDSDGASVIIIGFGRYGQIVGRLLFAQGITATVLDHDPDQIDMLRRFGFKVSLDVVDALQKEFPHLKIVACARNVRHWFELVERGLDKVERETFESALRTGRQALEALGVEPYEAREVADLFRRHNLAALQELRPHFRDEAKTVALEKSGQRQLEAIWRDQEMREARRKAEGWH